MERKFGPEDQKIRINGDFELVRFCEETRMRSALSFYDFQEMSSINGMDVVVRYKKPNLLRFGDVAMGNCSLGSYYQLEETIASFFFGVLRFLSDKICYIVKYNDKWVVDSDPCTALASLLDRKQVKNAYNCIRTEKTSGIVELFASSCFRYNSFVQFIFPEMPIIISPTDHLDIFFSGPSREKLYELLTNTFSIGGYESLEIACDQSGALGSGERERPSVRG